MLHVTMSSISSEKTPEKSTAFEAIGIERVPEDDRQHTQLRDTMWIWLSSNAVVATVAIGMLNIYYGLGFWLSLAVILVFNALAVIPVSFMTTLGPKTGLAQIPLAQFSFGPYVIKLPALLNCLACIGWSAVNASLGADLIVSVTGNAIPWWVALLCIIVIVALISIFGYFIVHSFERFAWIPVIAIYLYIAIAAAPHFNINQPMTAQGGMMIFSGILTFGGAIFGNAIGWSSYAADYTRHMPASASSRRVFTYSFLGIMIPCVLLEVIGLLLTTGVKGDTVGDLVINALGQNALTTVVLLLLALSVIANNVLSDYSFGLSMQVLGLKSVKRWILTAVGALAYTGLAFVLHGNFSLNLQGFLLLIAYWLGVWTPIILIEHAMRKGAYPIEDCDNPSKLPVGIAALVTFIISIGIAVLGINQASVIGYEGPLSHLLADADIGFPLAVIVASILYYPLRKMEKAKFGR
uniref:Cytosine permease n=1 Tax=Thermosporothrix sp. COM3 TaxID=2490863 RepID=A0A455SES5_9CHLR|nr:cytosine permease [Thermosporothrix sp. COM3]